MKKISPSILDVPKEKLTEYVTQLITWGVNNVHYDVMDHIFVPNSALTFEEIKKIHVQCPAHIMDIHLMVKDIFKYYEMYKNIGNILTFHYEAMSQNELTELIARAKSDGVKLGIALKPNTPVEEIAPYLKHLDLVLIMSVEPGFGGQKFLDISYDKVKELKRLISKENTNTIIQIDGGVKQENIRYCFDSGVDLAVVGSYLVKNFSLETIENLLKN
ncbi:ribulose-phosphate 3-epimerase [Metamycoplasma neophronis]|uniref:Ribulose-phosphate 3-epimerase n=1 Tax=Metamycoplasma neophronis TaxID=872983 RepID=A0ABY2Z0P0_9BACT|nr:ribulose-phosphate 3-epimerase [Metamycoplasma neophronis]TPR54723.1 ribulose-phosphate 3-epimerase [Metamycoplasma neophronis]